MSEIEISLFVDSWSLVIVPIVTSGLTSSSISGCDSTVLLEPSVSLIPFNLADLFPSPDELEA